MKSSKPRGKCFPTPFALSAAPEEWAFAEVMEMIQIACGLAVAAVNTALVTGYQTRLPDKKLLQAKLHEFYALTETAAFDVPNDASEREIP